MKVRDFTPDQYELFRNIIAEAAVKGWSGGETQDYIKGQIGPVGLRTVYRYLEKAKGKQPTPSKPKQDIAGTCQMKGTGSETAELDYYSDKRIRTLEEALAKGNVDRERWDVDRWEITSWEVGSKGPDKKIRVTPLWRVSVKLKARKGWDPSEFRAILKEDLTKLAPSYDMPVQREAHPDLLLELSIFDAHFGKLAWRMETNQDYDIRICRDRYLAAARDLLARGQAMGIGRIVYVVGNDFFHVDHKGLTTNGTPMDTDGRWQKAFRAGVQACITVAEEATQIAPVDILVVPGNHDREKAFCLGEVLEARFHQNHYITVDNDPDLTSYYRWGKNLLGFVHGDNHTSDAKRNQLPLQMATDRPVDWSETVWREIHLGHFHSEREDVWKYRTTDHIRDVAVRILPSLSSTDAWHREQGYASVLAAEAHVYHKQRGRYAYLNYQVDPGE
jgi:hypothetical protein